MSGADVVTTIVDLVGALVWPAVMLTIFLVLRQPLKELIRNIKSLSVSAGGTDVSVALENATTAVTAAVATKSGAADSTGGVITDAQNARSSVGRAAEMLQRTDATTSRRGLWVDDEPENNRFERAALDALGIHFDVCTTTDDATRILGTTNNYSIIISDMSRPGDRTAGLTLLDWLRSHRIDTPCLIYAGSATPQQIATTKEHGGVDQTSDPTELLEKVAAALSGR